MVGVSFRQPDRNDKMTPHFKHWLAKTQVEVTAAAGMAAMWFLAWPMLRPWDGDGALVFVPSGAYASLGVFAGIVLLVAVVCAVLTLGARPEGADAPVAVR